MAQEADLHLAPRPGTNLALMNAILHEVIANGWYDKDYVTAHTIGFDQLAKLVAEYPPERAAEICGIPAGQVREAAAMLGTSERLLSTVLQGFYQSNQATAASCQVNNLHLLRGMLGRPGAGLYQMNGQPTAPKEPERLHAQLFTGARSGPLGLLRDLQDLHLMACQSDICWTVIGQADQGALDEDLRSLVHDCESQTALQVTWLRTRMKQAAPQVLVVAA